MTEDEGDQKAQIKEQTHQLKGWQNANDLDGRPLDDQSKPVPLRAGACLVELRNPWANKTFSYGCERGKGNVPWWAKQNEAGKVRP